METQQESAIPSRCAGLVALRVPMAHLEASDAYDMQASGLLGVSDKINGCRWRYEEVLYEARTRQVGA